MKGIEPQERTDSGEPQDRAASGEPQEKNRQANGQSIDCCASYVVQAAATISTCKQQQQTATKQAARASSSKTSSTRKQQQNTRSEVNPLIRALFSPKFRKFYCKSTAAILVSHSSSHQPAKLIKPPVGGFINVIIYVLCS